MKEHEAFANTTADVLDAVIEALRKGEESIVLPNWRRDLRRIQIADAAEKVAFLVRNKVGSWVLMDGINEEAA